MLRSLRWALIWALCILVLCLIPGKDLPRFAWADQFSLDKVVHLGVFAVLAVLLLRALLVEAVRSAVYWTIGACVVYGILLELMQGMLLTGRHADAGDVVANTLGVLAGVWWAPRRARATSPGP